MKRWLAWIPCLVYMAVLARTGAEGPSPDFIVYWRTAGAVLLSDDVAYSLARDGNMAFKYPPWILPAFFPFAWLSWGVAKAGWGCLQAFSLWVLVRWVLRQGARPWIAGLVTLCFAGIWTVHAYLGQVALPLAAFGAALATVATRGRGGLRFVLLAWAYSAKIFTVLPLLGTRLRLRDLALTVGFCLVLSLPVAMVAPGGITGMIASWTTSASSGTEPLEGKGLVTITGREAQGIPSLIFRVGGFDESNAILIGGVCATLLLVFGLAWKRLARSIYPADRWAGFLALTAIVQPLAGFYSFSLAFPLAALALERAVAARGGIRVAMAGIGVLCIGALTRKTLGESIGGELEWLSVKSWGVLLSAGSLLIRERPRSVPAAAQSPASAR
jgi:hypothetical protein